jgi:hypothetical protein
MMKSVAGYTPLAHMAHRYRTGIQRPFRGTQIVRTQQAGAENKVLEEFIRMFKA